MASAQVLVDHPYHPAVPSSSSYAAGDYSYRPDYASFDSATGYDSFVSPQRAFADHTPSPRPSPANDWSQYQDSSSHTHDSPLDSSPLPSKSSSIAATKLQKKPPRKSSVQRSKPSADSIDARPGLSDDPAYNSSPFPPPNRSISKHSLKNNLRKLAQTKDPDQYDTSIDLSRTTAENELRSGLAISFEPQASPSVSDVQFSRNSGGHSRSISGNSQPSSTSRSFTPTMPFALPSRQQDLSRPFTPTAAHRRSYQASQADSDYSAGDVYTNVADRTSSQRERSHTLDSYTSAHSRPPLLLNNSSNTTSTLSQSASSGQGKPRSRRNTNRSIDTNATTTPTSRTSLDRAVFPFMRAPSAPLDDASRAASIQAAREEFAQRQASKQRKYDVKERKAAERREKRGERRRRKSSAAAAHDEDIHASRNGSRVTTHTDEYDGNDPRLERARAAQRSATSPPGNAHRQSEREDMSETGEPPAPKVSRKRAVKVGYVGVVTWMKSRVLHLGG